MSRVFRTFVGRRWDGEVGRSLQTDLRISLDTGFPAARPPGDGRFKRGSFRRDAGSETSERRQDSCYNGYFQALRPKRTACGVFSLPAPDVHRTSLLHIKILTSPFITASFCCTIVSDMGYRFLSEWRNAASFCGNSVSHVFFLFRQLNLTCLFRRRVSDTLLG